MKRLHLFEFEDFPWFPETLRNGITDYLSFVANKYDVYKPIIPIIQKGMKASGTKKIIDIASGGGGGVKLIQKHLKNDGLKINIVLTDLYPNLGAYEKLREESGGEITYVEETIDATEIPEHLNGFRMQLLSFHHFQPHMCKKILDNAVKNNVPIGIFELYERDLKNLISVILVPFYVLYLTLLMRPVKPLTLLFTYLVPILPVIIFWDGMVSVLRSYTTGELLAMAPSIDGDGYIWEAGKVSGASGDEITYLLGIPQSKTEEH